MNRRIEFYQSASAFFLCAAALLILPLRWIVAALLAAGVHEFCHYGMLRLLGIPIYRFRIGLAGAVMETAPMEAGQELICALAGPAGSLLLVLLIRKFPVLAVCGFVQGFYNLLPLFPLDGGRVVRSILIWCYPGQADKLMNRIQSGVILALSVLGFYACCCLKLGLGAGALIFFPVLKELARKIPCKEGREGIQ